MKLEDSGMRRIGFGLIILSACISALVLYALIWGQFG
jgi:hypothetical protein